MIPPDDTIGTADQPPAGAAEKGDECDRTAVA